ncbi:MAG: hypothetical protein L6Q46_02590 [Flavobacterium sp.]|uniref:hypothetical protein n=1 Tax=Flavobacterium sp. TaxID=239 RepID=UPI0025C44B86|nr:hypothetical protein [Flavobacterium sp.]MCK6607175.1 hypothetical protein [Flavobacterium sp.]
MKKYFIILLLLSNVCLFAQMKTDTIQPILQPIKIDMNLNTNKHFFTFNQLNFYTKNDFSIFNRTTMMNDNFSVYKGHYEFKNSVFIPENMVFNSKIDSFNPSGTDEFGSALLMGVLNLAEQLFQSK